MTRGLRVGVFGGTFDPPHVGHVVVARQVADHARLDRVVWVPANVSPHKLDSAPSPGTLRREMVEAVAGLDPRFSASTIELDREGPSYTVDTLRALTAEHPDWALFLILGADQMAVFDTWKDPKEIGRMSTLLVVERDGEAPKPPPGVDGMALERVPVTRVDISASGLRRRIANNRSIRHMVPDAVRAIIEREQLYRA
ncbi:MAG: nicotinate-nucleotide adenylyltransferase [Gemmatimonadota bacterium]|nr:nicotinate-nucleotide adenylyltransferase [Gemmatimonadota bacterium]